MGIGDLNRETYGASNFVCYLLLRDPAAAGEVADAFNDHYDFEPFGGELGPVELVPLTDIYFRNEVSIYKSGSQGQVLLLVAIGILILIIGLINFTNFYVALTPLRIRSANLQKILGSSTGRLRALVVGESVLWCLCAFGLAAVLLGPVSRTCVAHGVMVEAFSADGLPGRHLAGHLFHVRPAGGDPPRQVRPFRLRADPAGRPGGRAVRRVHRAAGLRAVRAAPEPLYAGVSLRL